MRNHLRPGDPERAIELEEFLEIGLQGLSDEAIEEGWTDDEVVLSLVSFAPGLCCASPKKRPSGRLVRGCGLSSSGGATPVRHQRIENVLPPPSLPGSSKSPSEGYADGRCNSERDKRRRRHLLAGGLIPGLCQIARLIVDIHVLRFIVMLGSPTSLAPSPHSCIRHPLLDVERLRNITLCDPHGSPACRVFQVYRLGCRVGEIVVGAHGCMLRNQ